MLATALQVNYCEMRCSCGRTALPEAGPEVVEEDAEDGDGRDGEADGRWTNVERSNRSHNESLRKLTEQ